MACPFGARSTVDGHASSPLRDEDGTAAFSPQAFEQYDDPGSYRSSDTGQRGTPVKPGLVAMDIAARVVCLATGASVPEANISTSFTREGNRRNETKIKRLALLVRPRADLHRLDRVQQ